MAVTSSRSSTRWLSRCDASLMCVSKACFATSQYGHVVKWKRIDVSEQYIRFHPENCSGSAVELSRQICLGRVNSGRNSRFDFAQIDTH